MIIIGYKPAFLLLSFIILPVGSSFLIMDVDHRNLNRARTALTLDYPSTKPSLVWSSKTRSTIHKKSVKSCSRLHLKANTNNDDNNDNRRQEVPSLIIFDLDGCLWRPEMYELLYFSGGAGAPFTKSPDYDEDGTIYTRAQEPVRLLGQVRDVMRELYCDEETWGNTQVGISSRTNQPEWAMELLEKFTITRKDSQDTFALIDVFQGPIEIGAGSKVGHFEKISKKTGIPMKDILFFDNERGNCNDVSKLGVSVAYCPDGVTKKVWDKALEAFPASTGKIVEDYDTFYGDGYHRTQW